MYSKDGYEGGGYARHYTHIPYPGTPTMPTCIRCGNDVPYEEMARGKYSICRACIKGHYHRRKGYGHIRNAIPYGY